MSTIFVKLMLGFRLLFIVALTGTLVACGNSGGEAADKACNDFRSYSNWSLPDYQPETVLETDARYDELDGEVLLASTNCKNGSCEGLMKAKWDAQPTLDRLRAYQNLVGPLLDSAVKNAQIAAKVDDSFDELFSTLYDLDSQTQLFMSAGERFAVNRANAYSTFDRDIDGYAELKTSIEQIEDLSNSIEKFCTSIA